MTTTTKTRASRRSERRPPQLAPTLGPVVCAWIERFLVHAEGDYFGQPFRLRRWQKRFIYRAYELEPDGSRRYDRGLLGLPKGNGKTELAAALACVELAGPVVFDGWDEQQRPRGKARTAPDIPVAAASFEQANTLYGAAKTMISNGPLERYFELYDTEILPKHGPGRLYRVAAIAGTNDGRRPTFFIADELHEWTGNKERVHLVLSNGRAKRTGAWELAISTAGWDSTSLLGRLYAHGRRIQIGEEEDQRFLFEWLEASADLDLRDPEQLLVAVLEANPAAGDFLAVSSIEQKYHEVPDFEFRRYFLNQWVSAPERWLPPGTWEGRADPARQVPVGTRVAIGFDGSYSGDSTAIVGATIEQKPHLFVIATWDKPAGAVDWRVDIPDVEHTIVQACGEYRVVSIGCDPFRWQRSLAVLAEARLPVVEWPSHLPSRMVPACAQFYDAVANAGLTQDGDGRLLQHIANAVVKIDSRGPRITKDHKDSERRIDLAVAAVIAYDMAVRALNAAEVRWRIL